VVEVKEALCIKDVINIGNSRISVAFYNVRTYPVYIEDDGRSIWAFNEKGSTKCYVILKRLISSLTIILVSLTEIVTDEKQIRVNQSQHS
jgi:hypothetical protein